MQQPPIIGSDGHSHLAARVADEWHEAQVDAVVLWLEHLDAFESQPFIAPQPVVLPCHIGPAPSQVALALANRHGVHCRQEFVAVDVNSRLGEVGQAAGMVRVEVRHDNVSDLLGLVSQLLKPVECRLLWEEARP